MPLKLMYITNRPEIAQIAESAGVDRVFVDMEYIGKQERQGGMDTVQSHHTIEDVATVRSAITTAELLVRCNPLHEGTKDEVDRSIECGADWLMLPYFHTADEVKRFVELVDGRAKTIPLVETPGAVDEIDEILRIDGLDELYIGLNDLSLGYGKRFMFELLSDGTVERLCFKFRQRGVPYGFGGIASIGKGELPAELIIKEHYRLGSTRAILSRSFCDTSKVTDMNAVRSIFADGIESIRGLERECEQHQHYFTDNRHEVERKIMQICCRGGAMKLLLTGAWRDAKASICELERLGHDVCFLQNEDEPLPCPYDWVEGVVGNGLFLHHAIGNFTNLRYIQLTSAGYDRVPLEYIQEHGIEIRNARGVYSAPMAEFAVCGVLALYKRLPVLLENQRAHVWQKCRDLRELTGKAVCVVGCGSVGTECAKRFAAFGWTVTGVDIQPYENPYFAEILPLDRLDETLKSADVVILTLPLTEQTRYLLNADRFALMKPDAVLVNISRGGTVNPEALIHTLQARPAFGAVLDVFEEEPLDPANPLWELPNALLTPHVSFVGDGNGERLKELILKNIQEYVV